MDERGVRELVAARLAEHLLPFRLRKDRQCSERRRKPERQVPASRCEKTLWNSRIDRKPSIPEEAVELRDPS
jgi:hypothetical protein